jgi:maleate cis-trans isomerase
MYKVTPEEWYDLIMERRDDEADGYFLSCTAIRTASIIERLESDLGRPVISSNQSTIWHCLRSLGIEDKLEGYGKLLARH